MRRTMDNLKMTAENLKSAAFARRAVKLLNIAIGFSLFGVVYNFFGGANNFYLALKTIETDAAGSQHASVYQDVSRGMEFATDVLIFAGVAAAFALLRLFFQRRAAGKTPKPPARRSLPGLYRQFPELRP